jgi:CRP/FNR family transcriptional regulator, cyclic AMP receptor protein
MTELWSSFIAARQAELAAMLSDPLQWIALLAGVAAGALVLASAFVKTIVPLRWLAVGSNIFFVVYGLVHPAPLVLVLHLALLPINLWRVLEMQRLTRAVQRAQSGQGLQSVWLQPFMKRRRMRKGAWLFRKGDFADRFYVLADGALEVVEAGTRIAPGQMVGEISFFTPEGRRTASVRCLETCTLLSVDEGTFRQLFFQNPAFGFEIVRLVAGRLSQDLQRARQDAAEAKAGLAELTARAAEAQRHPPAAG